MLQAAEQHEQRGQTKRQHRSINTINHHPIHHIQNPSFISGSLETMTHSAAHWSKSLVHSSSVSGARLTGCLRSNPSRLDLTCLLESLIFTGIHTFRVAKYRTWFCPPFFIGGLFEGIGYAGRAAAHDNLESTTPYIVQSILILIAPILFAASIYMILGRLILRTNSGSLCILGPSWVTKIFVGGDVLCFLIQWGGAGMLVQATDANAVNHWKIGSRQRRQRYPGSGTFFCLYAASTFITVRNTGRVIEYATGRDGYLFTHEWCLYVYDFIPMMLTLFVCIAWYDPNIHPNSEKTDIDMGILR
ncbi:RTA1-domain-containing protein [Lindgomyces ingoldianus]|uniref:RTA1-domain-containing protein n=1 Tax=Lindgomyces ingoldianus TaxID=673940 RepID=A0ACB6QQC5_9PLEO|nr:RTA1-domain-containing protein [Lindgomyces ingoldianus]KAF2469219.1 RTA1-domain-containing protein [Lindgomyces ingoldianus]